MGQFVIQLNKSIRKLFLTVIFLSIIFLCSNCYKNKIEELQNEMIKLHQSIFSIQDTLEKNEKEINQLKSKVIAHFEINTMLGNTLFYEFDNPFYLNLDGYNEDSLEFFFSNGTFTKRFDNYYIIPNSFGEILLNIYNKTDSGKILIFTKEYSVRFFPYIKVTIGGKFDGKVSKEFLLSHTELKGNYENFDIPINVPITGYKLVCYNNNSKKESISENNLIGDEQKTLIKKLKSGDFVYFQDIKLVTEIDSLQIALRTLCFEID
jgi:hypothetical protein